MASRVTRARSVQAVVYLERHVVSSGYFVSLYNCNDRLYIITLHTNIYCISFDWVHIRFVNMKFLIVCLYFLIGFSNAADLAKIFKNGMVLQSNPTTAVIWGWQEGNPDDWPPVYLTADCENEDGIFKINKRFISKKVWVLLRN